MKFKYKLNQHWIDKVSNMSEFANGATQVSVRTEDGTVNEKVLISNATWIIAMKGRKDLPFSLEKIIDIFQTEEDLNPKKRDDWHFWDDWENK